jgi:PIF1-like helicase
VIVTATSGTAAFSIKRSTFHSALGIPVENGDKPQKMSWKKMLEWADRQYLIVDEFSAMDCKLIVKLHDKLCSAKSAKDDVEFGGVKIVFLGDFRQLPSVSPFRLYMDRLRYQQGHHL